MEKTDDVPSHCPDCGRDLLGSMRPAGRAVFLDARQLRRLVGGLREALRLNATEIKRGMPNIDDGGVMSNMLHKCEAALADLDAAERTGPTTRPRGRGFIE